MKTLQMFITTQELYLQTVIDKLAKVVGDTLSSMSQKYSNTTEAMFFVFIVI